MASIERKNKLILKCVIDEKTSEKFKKVIMIYK